MKRKNKVEATKLIEDVVREYERLSYDELYKWVDENKIKTETIKGPSGIEYQVELVALWDDKPDGVIRFSGSIYDDSETWFLRIKTPISYDFLKEK